MAYIGQQPFNNFSSVPSKDTFTGDGSTTVFDLNGAVVSGGENALEVFVDNVRQEPGSGKAFTLGVDGSNINKRITFTAAPANGSAIYVINDKTSNTSTISPKDLNGVELVLDADADTSITADTDDQIDFKIAGSDHFKILGSSGDTVLQASTDAKDIIFKQFDGRNILEVNDAGFVALANGATGSGQLRIYEDTDNGTNFTALQVGTQSADITYTLPTADGTSGFQLTTDGSGVLSWTAAGTTITNNSNNRIVTGTGSALNGEANLTFDGSTLAVTGAITGSSDLTLQDDLILDSDASTIQFGADQDVVLTHVADTGLLLSGTNVIQFNDASQNIGAPSNTILDINATDEIELNATLVDVNANLDVSGTIVSAGTISGTLATAAQGNITSLGTLTTLTVDNVITNGSTIGHTSDTDLITLADSVVTVAGEISVTTLDIGGTNVTSTAAELNLLDGVSGLVQADLTKLAAIDATAAEINLIDGGTSRGTTAVVDADGLLINDDGTMRMTTAATVKTYMQSGLTSTSILDADSDTKIQVEESSDEDIIRYDVAGAEVATQTARGFEFTAVGGFMMNQTTNSQTFTIAATENAMVAGPIALSGTITVSGSLAVV